MPPGTYLCSQTIHLPDGVDLSGAGWSRSWLKGRVDFGSRSVVSDLKIGDAGRCAVHNRKAVDTRFVDCRFRGGGGRGDDAPVIMLGGSDNTGSSLLRVTFERCSVERNAGVEDWSVNNGYGYGFNDISVHENPSPGGSHVQHLVFRGCHIGVANGAGGHDTGSPRAGIEVWTGRSDEIVQGWGHLTISGSTFEATDRFCIDLADYDTPDGRHLAGPALIEDNLIKGAGRGDGPRDWSYCICLEAPRQVTIRGNTIYGAHLTTICGSYADAADTVIDHNTIDLTVPNGVEQVGDEVVVLRGGGGSFTGNVVRAGAGAGPLLYLKKARRQVVSGNRLYQLQARGAPPILLIADASGNRISGNLLSIAPGGEGIRVIGSSSGNVITGNRELFPSP